MSVTTENETAQGRKVLSGIFLLLEDIYPRNIKPTMRGIIDLNQGSLGKYLETILDEDFTSLFAVNVLENLNEYDFKWNKLSEKNLKRKNLLFKLLRYTKQEHIELLNLEKVRNYLSIEQIKLIMTQTTFIDFSIREKAKNIHLSIQANALQVFLYYHLLHDLRFRSKIDSMKVEMDNPFMRQQIREENRSDPIIGEKYLANMEVDEWCKHLLENFFPNISGLWADHTHIYYVIILRIVRVCFEYGFFDLEDCPTVLQLIAKVSSALLRLEEAFHEKLSTTSKTTESFMAYNAATHLAACRENIACILIQIITFYYDDYFLRAYPIYLKKKLSPEKAVQRIMEDVQQTDVPFFDKTLNTLMLDITMNYLTVAGKVGDMNCVSSESMLAVEKIFLYITSSSTDMFIESLKEVSTEELRYFEAKDIISASYRGRSDDICTTIKELLSLIAHGGFHSETLIKAEVGFPLESSLKQIINNPQRSADLVTVVEAVLSIIRPNIDDNDFKFALVKENIPILLLALCNYVDQFFKPSNILRGIFRDVFMVLESISKHNNACKAQIFRGDGLYHFNKLVDAQNKYTFYFLNGLCDDENIAIYLTRGFLPDLIRVYVEFQNKIVNKMTPLASSSSLITLENIEDFDEWSLYIILTKLLISIMTKRFKSEIEKQKACLMIQEAIYPHLCNNLLPRMLGLLKELKEPTTGDKSMILVKSIFRDSNLKEMVSYLEEREDNKQLTDFDANVLLLQLCFSSLRGFNVATSNSYSAIIKKSVYTHLSAIKDFLKTFFVEDIRSFHPYGLDAEFLKLLKTFYVIPEASFLIERCYDLKGDENEVFDSTDTPLEDIQSFLHKLQGYNQNSDLKEEAELFLMEGIFPYIYKYLNAVFNLTNYSRYNISSAIDRIKEARKTNRVEDCWPKLQSKMAKNNVHYSLEIIKEILWIYGQNVEVFNIIIPNNIVSSLRNYEHPETEVGDEKGKGVVQNTDPEVISQQKILEIIDLCNRLMRDIEKFYEGSSYSTVMQEFKEKQDEDARDEDDTAIQRTTTKDSKRLLLESFVEGLEKAKNLYIDREENPNLFNFFDSHPDNLKGVFISCHNRFYQLKKQDREKKHNLTADIGTNRFWMDSSCFAFVQLVDKMIAKSKKARDEFFDFINSDKGVDEDESDELAVLLKKKSSKKGNSLREAQLYAKLDNWNVKRPTEFIYMSSDILGVLMRIEHDLFLFLLTSPTLKPIWWDMLEYFEIICMFFKNLCENNHMSFKKHFSTFIPKTKDSTWNENKDPITKIFANQLHHLLESSKLAGSRESTKSHSDQYKRVEPMLKPLISVVNELITGPCQQNVAIIHKTGVDSLITLMTRTIDDLSDKHYELKHSVLILLLSLRESGKENIIDNISKKISPSIILNQIQRVLKKMYIRELINNNEFNGEVEKQKRLNAKIKQRALKAKKRAEPSLNKVSSGGLSSTEQSDIDLITIDRKPSMTKDTSFDELPEFTEDTAENHSIITHTMETSIFIKDWDTLYDLYLINKDFSNGYLFDFVFRMMIFWKLLSERSKRHKSRYQELHNESKFYFEEKKGMVIDDQKEIYSIMYFFDKIMLSIEAVDPNGKHIIIYFPREPECFMLSDEAKKVYRESCDISDANTKMLDLMRNFKLFRIQMEGNLQAYRTTRLFYRLASNDSFALYLRLVWILSLILNLVMAFVIARDDAGTLHGTESWADTFIDVFCFSLAGISALFLLLWLSQRYTQTYKVAREDFKFDNPDKNPNTVVNFIKIAFNKSILNQPIPINMFLHLVFSLLGGFYSYALISLNLVLIINISQTTKFVVKATFLHIDQLVLTLILTIFVMFSYTILVADLYNDLLAGLPEGEGGDICTDLYNCFVFTINYGLRNGGGIAESLNLVPTTDRFYQRAGFDASFFLIVNVVALNIIFGIIIDTFSQLRDEQQERSNAFGFNNNRPGQREYLLCLWK